MFVNEIELWTITIFAGLVGSGVGYGLGYAVATDWKRPLYARLARIERMMELNLRVTHREVQSIMALRATDNQVIAEIHRTANVANAAVLAINALQDDVKSLTQKLADAIADSPAADNPAVVAALAELTASNDKTVAATPVIAAAIANTDPAAPPPVVTE